MARKVKFEILDELQNIIKYHSENNKNMVEFSKGKITLLTEDLPDFVKNRIRNYAIKFSTDDITNIASDIKEISEMLQNTNRRLDEESKPKAEQEVDYKQKNYLQTNTKAFDNRR